MSVLQFLYLGTERPNLSSPLCFPPSAPWITLASYAQHNKNPPFLEMGCNTLCNGLFISGKGDRGNPPPQFM